jgi:NAD(P)-dependent dehydrogenase (short-subunit alcohol dehydrogenase family)
MEVRDKAVVVTGAGGLGSGRAIALRFAREGAHQFNRRNRRCGAASGHR